MKILEDKFKKNSKEFESVYCDDSIRIWKVSGMGSQWYECHLRKFQKESIMKVEGADDVVFEAKERYPSDEDFGKWAWTFKTIEECRLRLDRALAAAEANRIKKAQIKSIRIGGEVFEV